MKTAPKTKITRPTTRKKKPVPKRKIATRVAKKALVPHAKNNYQPHATRHYGLVILALAIGFLNLSYNYSQTGRVLGVKTDVNGLQLLAETNDRRTSEGEGSLQLNEKLNKAAQLKADDMFQQQYWAHTAPNGTTPWKWFDASKYAYQNAGENLAKGFHTSGGVVKAWMNSDEHRENLLNTSYKDVGFAVKTGELNGEETTLVVALYGNPAGAKLAGATPQQTVLASTNESLGFVSRIGVGVQSMTPAMIGSIALLLLGAFVAFSAHRYRKYMPRYVQSTWRKHHGMYKAISMTSFIFVLLALYGGGQI
jgi:uncharacterized protein YkwD